MIASALIVGHPVLAHRALPAPALATVAQRIVRLKIIRPQRLVKHPGWGAGEALRFRIRLAGIEAAQATVVIGQPLRSGADRTLKVRAFGQTTPLMRNFVALSEDRHVLLAVRQLKPLRSHSLRIKGDSSRKITTRFDRWPVKQLVVRRTANRESSALRQRRLPRDVRDPLTAMLFLRSTPLMVGATTAQRVLVGLVLYELRLRVVGKKRLRTTIGAFDAMELRGEMRRIADDGKPLANKQPRRAELWLSDDSRRLPLLAAFRSDYGWLEVELDRQSAAKQPIRLR